MSTPFFNTQQLMRQAAFAGFLLGSMSFVSETCWAGMSTAKSLLQDYAAQAGVAPSSEKGRTFFVTKHGRDWACASCHGDPPVSSGRHASTNKAIEPLAPGYSAERFTNLAKTEKWFRRNCKDVLARECSMEEKANILSYLISLGGKQ